MHAMLATSEELTVRSKNAPDAAVQFLHQQSIEISSWLHLLNKGPLQVARCRVYQKALIGTYPRHTLIEC